MRSGTAAAAREEPRVWLLTRDCECEIEAEGFLVPTSEALRRQMHPYPCYPQLGQVVCAATSPPGTPKGFKGAARQGRCWMVREGAEANGPILPVIRKVETIAGDMPDGAGRSLAAATG